ncbi:hypothetical protein SKAU_G00404980 [Synaphobranchus kaupii]|uniref:Uncharacterized protein n=1 Tax=Synaphobranchus kaupii TaxID=118154 RepID=A0A9Q1ICQ4_SYNKA|nr:hypothetical protein SKAU_G00404980 [Synaphobranchus kaupii]
MLKRIHASHVGGEACYRQARDTLYWPNMQGVPERLRVKHQIAKFWYDKSARDLPELSIGQDIRMKPLPGDRTGRWRKGVCLQQVGPRSYLVDVEGTFYRRNRVDLRPAEREALGHHPEKHSKQHSSPSQTTMDKDKDGDTVNGDTGFAQENQFTLNANKKDFGNSVYLVSDTRSIPCDVERDSTHGNQITCYTRPMPYGTYVVRVTVDGVPIPKSHICNGANSPYWCSFYWSTGFLPQREAREVERFSPSMDATLMKPIAQQPF